MRPFQLVQSANRAAGRFVDALADPARRERAALAALAGFTVLWTLYGVIAKGGQDIHYDMAEAAELARHPALGYAKNPPFVNMLVAGWFSVFPRADWSFYLLAMTSVAVGLWAAWQLFGRFLEGEKRAIALALLTFIPLLTFHGLKFNNNVLMFPLWALTTLFFVRSYEDRKLSAAALAGLFAAAAMLTKYWSIFLLAGLAFAALAGPHRGRYFRSAAPWITIAAGSLALAPHAVWLVQNDFSSFNYAYLVHGGRSALGVLRSVSSYLLNALAYCVALLAVVLIVTRPNRAALRELLAPAGGRRRFIALAFWIPLLLPIAVALATRSEIVALWTAPAWTLLPVVLLSPPSLIMTRKAAVSIVTIAIALPVAAVMFAPAVAFAIHRAASLPPGAYYKPLAQATERVWRQTSAQPLRFVGGDSEYAYGAAFYLHGPVIAFPDLNRTLAPWVDSSSLLRDGIALICPFDSEKCVNRMKSYAGNRSNFQLNEVTLSRRFFGVEGAARRFLIIVVPPQRALAGALAR